MCTVAERLWLSLLAGLQFLVFGFHARVIAPIVLGIAHIAILPSVPFFLRKIVRHLAVLIENFRVLAKKKIANAF